MTNRITPYEAGWLSMLVRRGICSEKDAREAQDRVACEAVEELAKMNGLQIEHDASSPMQANKGEDLGLKCLLDAELFPMDIVGIEGAESWDGAGLMRYRSKRDLLEIASNPVFGEKHDYKVAALEKTIAFPITTSVNLGDPRLILGLLTVIGVLLARRS